MMIDLQTTSVLSLETWPDPPHVGPSVDLRSRYAEHFWIPVVGPTAMCLLRVLVRRIGNRDQAVDVMVTDLVSELGLSTATGWIDVERAFDRLLANGLICGGVDGPVRVRTDLPYLSQVQVDRLSPQIAVAHRAALVLRESASNPLPEEPLSPRMLSLTATIDEVLTNPVLDARQLAYRWQHVMRLAEEARDEAVLDWASPDLEVTLAEGQLAAQAVHEAFWSAVHLVAQEGYLPDEIRSTLHTAAAGVVDWVVSEFPDDRGAWDDDESFPRDWDRRAEPREPTFEDLLGLLDLDEGEDPRGR